MTVRQPWAWAIIHGGKNVENRSRNIAGSYRGPVAIHAGKAFDIMDLAKPEIVGSVFAARMEHGPGDPRTFKESPRAAIIGVVDLVDVHHATGCPEHRDGAPWPLCSPWAMRDHYHLILANPRALATPIPAKGKLGLWRPDSELQTRITGALSKEPAPFVELNNYHER